ncbi:MAG TPA: iron-containing alcohol dehydrogenase [Ideonella sp.]|uniref:ROK family protein n=1 Tax=Ideonella sp. TaxID=1929293 RepID=UPI002E321ABD|nr:iron-containing alcohol dehydrogenase [Ideonella sp.]HEX5684347.1 iron-containing alcohol dehydrogenase [Ideonella sp.]
MSVVGSPPICVFDIGGTWFRSALLLDGNTLQDIRRTPAISFHNNPGLPVRALQASLVDYLASETRRLGGAGGCAAVSMGAALNAHTGFVLNSGPLWGPNCLPFDLPAALAEADSEVQWIVVNDVTAALAYHVAQPCYAKASRLSLVTVSTGIALRTYDRRLEAYPVDRVHGIQGEIGHIPIAFTFRGEAIHLPCDCGGQDHLNAFCSGRGLEALVRHLAAAMPGEAGHLLEDARGSPPVFDAGRFARLATAGDPLALELLSAITLPLAEMILRLFALDPEVEHLILSGGVARGLGQAHYRPLVAHLERLGLYQVTTSDPTFFRKRIVLDETSDDSALLGCGRLATSRLRQTALRPLRSCQTLRVLSTAKAVAYAVHETTAALDPLNDALATLADAPACGVVVIDSQVEQHFGERIRAYFAARGAAPSFLVLHCAEQTKTLQRAEQVVRCLDAAKTRRRTPIIAMGGGVLLDIVGMAASQYRRGTPYVRVPTTLLAMVDAAIGVKVGVNFDGRKSRLGYYYPPTAVLIDRAFLTVLPERHIRNGLAEVLKIALMLDAELVAMLELHGRELIAERFQSSAGAQLMRRATVLMLDQLEPNLWEANLDRVVDFGHSFSPVVEMAAAEELLHGEAVAIDMVLSSTIAWQRGMIGRMVWDRIVSLVAALGLPLTHPCCGPGLLWRGLQETVLHRDGRQRLPMPTAIGQSVFCNDVTFAEVEDACRRVQALQGRHVNS